MTTASPRPIDATLSVTKAARLLGVHPNTIRAWSDAGRLRYYRINPRGDRRYRLGDLQRFLAAAAAGATEGGGANAAHGHAPGRRSPDGLPLRLLHGSRPAAGMQPAGLSPVPDTLDRDRRQRDLDLLADLALLAGRAGSHEPDGLDASLTAAVETIRDSYDHYLVAVWELRGEVLAPRAVAARSSTRLVDLPRSFGTMGEALAVRGTHRAAGDPAPAAAVVNDKHPEVAAVISGDRAPWGVLLVVGDGPNSLAEGDVELAVAAANAIGAAVRAARNADEIAHQLHRADALRRVAGDIGSRLDLDQILAGLVDHAMVLFEGNRAAVFLRRADGKAIAEVSRGLSPAYLNAVRDFPPKSLPMAAIGSDFVGKSRTALRYAGESPRETSAMALPSARRRNTAARFPSNRTIAWSTSPARI